MRSYLCTSKYLFTVCKLPTWWRTVVARTARRTAWSLRPPAWSGRTGTAGGRQNFSGTFSEPALACMHACIHICKCHARRGTHARAHKHTYTTSKRKLKKKTRDHMYPIHPSEVCVRVIGFREQRKIMLQYYFDVLTTRFTSYVSQTPTNKTKQNVKH